MAATLVAVQTSGYPAFGIQESGATVLGWGYWQSREIAEAANKVELEDEDGDLVAAAFHGFKKTITGELRVKTTIPTLTPGTQYYFELADASRVVFLLDDASIVESNKDWVTMRINATYYPSIAVGTGAITTTTTTTTAA